MAVTETIIGLSTTLIKATPLAINQFYQGKMAKGLSEIKRCPEIIGYSQAKEAIKCQPQTNKEREQ